MTRPSILRWKGILKWTGILVALGLATILAGLIVLTQIEKQQAEYNQQLIQKLTKQDASQKLTAIIYFSRSETTALLAHHLAQGHSARLFRLEAQDYKPGLMGWINAMLDARQHEARIMPKKIDLSAFDTVYLGSPIWLYSPAPPVWDFIKHNQFDGKAVILVNTFNSKFEQRFINEFKEIVMHKGARSFTHQYIKRGRIGQQLSAEEMLKAFDETWINKSY